jgi:hypothetical protein
MHSCFTHLLESICVSAEFAALHALQGIAAADCILCIGVEDQPCLAVAWELIVRSTPHTLAVNRLHDGSGATSEVVLGMWL